MLTKQQRDRNDRTKEPTNEKTTKDWTKPHASTEERTKNTRITLRYHVTSGRVVYSLNGGPWYHSLANELTYVRTPRLTATMAERVYLWQRGLAHITCKQTKLLRMVLKKYLTKHTHDFHGDTKNTTISRRRHTKSHMGKTMTQRV